MPSCFFNITHPNNQKKREQKARNQTKLQQNPTRSFRHFNKQSSIDSQGNIVVADQIQREEKQNGADLESRDCYRNSLQDSLQSSSTLMLRLPKLVVYAITT